MNSGTSADRMAIDNEESGQAVTVMKRIRRKLRLTTWTHVLKIAITVTILAFLISVYVKGLQQNRYVRRARFNLKKLHKRKGTGFANKHRAYEMQIPKSGGHSWQSHQQKEPAKDQFQLEQNSGYVSHKLHQQGLNKTKHQNNVTLIEFERNTELKTPLRGVRNGGLNIVIVEEHHEVIPYWFGAAKRGLIPKRGNTLIHFDGHSDLSQPTYFPGYPFFKWPSTPQEVQYLMQSNDIFIQASAMAGLFRRVVWVWPAWDKTNHDEDHTISDLSMGWFRPKEGKYKSFCMCTKNSTDDNCRTFTPYGNFSYDTVNISTFDGFPVPPRRCTVLRTIIVEEINENIAPAYFRRNKFMSQNASVVLDFDEDFFGCSFAVRPLLVVNMSVSQIDEIDNAVAAIFCPRTLAQEQPTDDIVQRSLKMIKIFKFCNNSTRNHSKICSARHYSSKKGITTNVLETIQHMANKNFTRACEPDRVKLKQLVQELVSMFSNLTSKQIFQLRMTGFCSETSPRTVVLDGERHFGVCKGQNGPNHTVVIEHNPTKTDIMARSRLLNESLQTLKTFSPRLATVSRSVRDGFTPRKHFEYIEKAIIKALNQTSPISTRIKYDNGLLGGKMGWQALHRL